MYNMHVSLLHMSFLVVLATAVHSKEVGGGCSNQVHCVVDPCQNASCPRFLNAECRPDNCNGACIVRFFRVGGNEVTDRCGVVTCEEKVCPQRRACIEEVVPSSCPSHTSRCRQYIRARCELRTDIIHPPSSCEQVECHSSLVCRVEESKRGTIARCRAPGVLTCDVVRCDEGMECREREREGNRPPVVRCVPMSSTPKPGDCTSLMCPSGTICMIFGSSDEPQARCVTRPPIPRDCGNLDCSSVSMVCLETDHGPRCVPPQNCQELQCPNGQQCYVVYLSGSSTPVCLPSGSIGRDCSEISCDDDQRCVFQAFQNSSVTVAACLPLEQVLLPAEESCANFAGERCDVEESEMCVDLLQPSRNTQSLSCIQTDCDEFGFVRPVCYNIQDTCLNIPQHLAVLTDIHHACIAVAARIEFNTSCAMGRHNPCPSDLVCTDVSFAGTTLGSVCDAPYPTAPTSCEGVTCGLGKECSIYEVDGLFRRGICLSSQVVAITLNNVDAILNPLRTCEERNCEEKFLACRELSGRTTCDFARNCEELNCLNGLQCSQLVVPGSHDHIATCVHSVSSDCSEVNCSSNHQVCVTQSFTQRSVSFAACYHSSVAAVSLDFPSDTPECEDVLCLENEECVTLDIEGTVIAFCVSSSTIDDVMMM